VKFINDIRLYIIIIVMLQMSSSLIKYVRRNAYWAAIRPLKHPRNINEKSIRVDSNEQTKFVIMLRYIY